LLRLGINNALTATAPGGAALHSRLPRGKDQAHEGQAKDEAVEQAAKDVKWLKGLLRANGEVYRMHDTVIEIILSMHRHRIDEQKLRNRVKRSNQPRPKKSRTKKVV
jgi:hypothetical protein